MLEELADKWGSSQQTAVQQPRIPTLNSEPRKAPVHLVMHYLTGSSFWQHQDSTTDPEFGVQLEANRWCLTQHLPCVGNVNHFFS